MDAQLNQVCKKKVNYNSFSALVSLIRKCIAVKLSPSVTRDEVTK
jgi:hypothetical protein